MTSKLQMAFIKYVEKSAIPAEHLIADDDNIIQIHGVHPAIMKQHFELYAQLMRRDGPLSFVQREMVAVVVSRINRCKY